MTEQMAGQVSLFDLDTWSGKTYQEPCPQTKEKTSDVSSKKRRASSKKMPLSLDLRKKDGATAEASWEMGILLRGESTIVSIGEFRSVGNVSLYCVTSTDTQPEKYCLTLNTSEYPREMNKTILSDILEPNAEKKYNLSPKACKGILKRANRRGKKLPDVLKDALERQATA